MKNSIKLLSSLLLVGIVSLCFTNNLNAQDVLSIEDMNSVYKKEITLNKKVQSYAPLREADVMWSRKYGEKLILEKR